MGRSKIDYGIDLGTTNSAICRMESNGPRLMTEPHNTMPSCIWIDKKRGISVGDKAYKKMFEPLTKKEKEIGLDVYSEFKRTMGSDKKYYSKVSQKAYSSEELSAELLKTLKSFIRDESISSIVITVPAKFTAPQTAATTKAAQLAGFTQCELLQEPIAAAMAYGLASKNQEGIWMVFDFGGGTFDVALLKIEDSIQKVFDTEGDNCLGGKNLDYAIVDKIIIPYLKNNYKMDQIFNNDENRKEWRNKTLKIYAESAKNELSSNPECKIITDIGELEEDDNGEEIELNITITQSQLYDVIRPYFQKAIDICKILLKRNNLTGSQLDKIILVGGPTKSPLISAMLKEQISENVDTSIDPMTAVATGAALYASTIDRIETEETKQEEGIIMLDIQYTSPTVQTEEDIVVKLKDSNKKIFVDLIRDDDSWSSGKKAISGMGNVISVQLEPSKFNIFKVMAYDDKGIFLKCSPSEIKIIQGIEVGKPPLSYNIGIGVHNTKKGRNEVFIMVTGLEKNKPLPAEGNVENLKTLVQLRPGVETDKLIVPIYQMDGLPDKANGKSTYLYEYITNIEITGDDVEKVIDKYSKVNVKVKVNRSQDQYEMEFEFPDYITTVKSKKFKIITQSEHDARNYIDKYIPIGQKKINKLKYFKLEDADLLQKKLNNIKQETYNSTEYKAVQQGLKSVLRDIEELEDSWEYLEKELREEFEHLEKSQKEYGDNKTAEIVEELRSEVDKVICKKDIDLGYEIKEKVTELIIHLEKLQIFIALIQDWQQNIDNIEWKNIARAKQLIDDGVKIIMNGNPTSDKLLPIVKNLYNNMKDRGGVGEGLEKYF